MASEILACPQRAGYAGARGSRPDWPVLRLPAHRLPAVRLCLPFLAAVLSSAIVLALAASVDPSRAVAASRLATGLSAPLVQSVSKPKASRRKPSSARRAECAAAAHSEKARKACAVAKAKGTKPSPSPKLAATVQSSSPSVAPSVATTSAPAPAIVEPSLVEALAEPTPESTPPAGSSGGSNKPPVEPPVEPKPPVELKAPIEPVSPVEESKSPVEELKAPVEEPKAPVEESKSPAEEPMAPVEEPTTPVEEPKPPIEAPPTGRVSTMTTLASSANPSTVGQGVTYTATIGALAATGTVEFKGGDVVISGCADRAVSFGIATCTVGGYATTVTHSITATYSGDGNYLTSTSSTLTQTILSAGQGTDQAVSKAATTTTLSSSSDPSTVGQSVIYTAIVGQAAATGTVSFDEDGKPIAGCAAQAISAGTATCTLSNLVAGGHWITAVYSGDGNYGSSTSSGLTQTVSKKITTTAVSSSLDPSTVGQVVTYTATVSAAAATGTVSFDEAGTPITGCTARPASSGTATCAMADLAAGGRWITAVYSGDSNYAASWSPGFTQTVSKKITTTAVSSSLDPSTVGQAVTFTATVSAAAATGTVSFDEAGTPITGCTAQPASSGTATCTVADLAAGGYWITAAYSGDSNYGSSMSPGLTQTIKKKATTTTVSSSLNPSTVGQAVTYTVTVSATAATGTVEFKQAGLTIAGCAAQPVSSGTATCTLSNLAAGGYWITAAYSGDSNYGSSMSPGLTQTVKKKTTTTTVSSSLDPTIVGETLTLTAMLSTTAATGTVEFEQAGVAIGGCSAQTVGSGTAKCTVANLAAGGHWVTAVYSGDSNYGSSTSSGLIQTVNKKTTTTTASSSSNQSTVGQAVTFTTMVSATAATGTVEFKQAGLTIAGCAAQPVSSGTATCTVADLAAGGHWVTAVYSGDSSYGSSTSPGLTQMVAKKTTTTAVSSSTNPSNVRQAVTYTATVSPATATGTVEFKEEGTLITGCAAEIISSGTATCTVTGYPKWSSYRITAAYSGDSSDLASASSMFTQTVEPLTESAAPFRFFSLTSFWNAELLATAPLDPSTAKVVSAFVAQVAEELEIQKGPAINTTSWSVPIYTVPAEQPTVKVTLENASQSPALGSAWDAVPLPAGAQPAVGTDKVLVVWQPSTDKLWEFWGLEETLTGWQARWGGAMQDASADSGAYGPEDWPGAKSNWGAAATSLSMAGGLITLEDLEKGQINHALAMSIPAPRGGVYASPAERTDGWSTEPLSIPEGARLRLDPSLNLASFHLPKLTLMMAEAAQRYGIFIVNQSANIAMYAQDPIPTGTNPYTGPHGFFEGKSEQQILEAFPWSHLQLLKMELHSIS